MICGMFWQDWLMRRVAHRQTRSSREVCSASPCRLHTGARVSFQDWLSARYPRLRLEVDLSDRYVDLLEDGYDVAIRIAEPTQSGLVSRQIDRFTLHACASPDYLMRKDSIVHPRDLVRHDCVVQRTYAPRNKWRFNMGDGAVEINIVPRIVVSDMAAARELVVSGAGISILPSYLVTDDIAAGRLVEVMPAASLPSVEVFASFSHHRRTLSKILVLIEELEATGSLSRRPPH